MGVSGWQSPRAQLAPDKPPPPLAPLGGVLGLKRRLQGTFAARGQRTSYCLALKKVEGPVGGPSSGGTMGPPPHSARWGAQGAGQAG